MNVQEILDRIEDVNSRSNYWFVRTNDGELYDNFFSGNYIAIGWDYITRYQLNNQDSERIKNSIAEREEIDTSVSQGKSQVTAIYNKLINFLNLTKNDIVIIPSLKSERLAFGRIVDDEAYDEESAQEFVKRRKVKWLKEKLMEDLNPIFYRVKRNQHAVSNVNGYAKFIDREVGNLFKKDDNTHYVLSVEKEEDINFDELKSLIDNIGALLNNINENLGFDENPKDFYVKVNLQSKGLFELIKSGKSLAVLAYLIFLSSCGTLENETNSEIKKIIDDNRDTLEKTSRDIDTLNVNIDELTKPFRDNGN